VTSAEGGPVPNGVGVWWGISPLRPARGSWERREFPQWGPGQSPVRKRILAYFEGHRMLLFVSMWQKSEGDKLH